MGSLGASAMPPLAATSNALRPPVRKVKPLPAIVAAIGTHSPQPHKYIAESPVPRPAHIRRITARTHGYAPSGRLSRRSCQHQCISFLFYSNCVLKRQRKLFLFRLYFESRCQDRASSRSRKLPGTGTCCPCPARCCQPKAVHPLAKPVGN